jgi:uncharacterized SAM-binding protein YcdF (DUF218 family)
MFIVSKVLSFITQPLAWVALALGLGVVLQTFWPKQWAKLGRRLCWIALVVLLLQGWQPLPQFGIRQLESRYPVPQNLDLFSFEGIVVLGGALESAYVWQAPDLNGRPQAQLNGAAERMTAPIGLLKSHPHLKLIFTGGSGEILGSSLSEAQRAQIFYQDMGLMELPQADQRFYFEAASRNTYENAILSAKLPDIDTSKPWLLVTSAFHMPRSIAVFQKAGWNVTPYPVDYLTGDATPWTEFSLNGGAGKWEILLHEWIGTLYYALTHKS